MTGSPFSMNPFHQVSPTRTGAPATASAPARACPFASNCSCRFAPTGSAGGALISTETVLHSPEVLAEVSHWTRRGWKVASASSRRVVLERVTALPFCVNLGLSVVTGLLWLAYWIPRSRSPKIDTRIITVAVDGQVTVTRLSHRLG